MFKNLSIGYTSKGAVWYQTTAPDGTRSEGRAPDVQTALAAVGIAPAPVAPADSGDLATIRAQSATIADLRRQLAAALAAAPAQPVADSPATPPACADSGPVATVTPIRAKRAPAPAQPSPPPSPADPVAAFAAAQGFVGASEVANG